MKDLTGFRAPMLNWTTETLKLLHDANFVVRERPLLPSPPSRERERSPNALISTEPPIAVFLRSLV